MATNPQAELEPDSAPEWAGEVDVSNAGIREGSVVRQMSVQEQVDAQAQTQPYQADPPFQEALQQSGFDPVNPTSYQRGTGSDEADRYAAGVLGGIRSMRTGEDVYDAIDAKYDEVTTSVDARELIANEVLGDATEALRNELRVAAEASEGDVKKLMAVYQEIQRWDTNYRSTAGFEAYTESQLNAIAAIKSADGNRVMEENYFRMYGDAKIGKVWEATSTPRAWYDGLKAGIGISGTVAMADFTEKFEPGLFSSIVNTLGETVGRIPHMEITGRGFQAYKQTLEAFWQLPVSQRVVALDAIEKHIREISYNPEAGAQNVFVYMGMMMPFVDKTEATSANLDYLTDSITVLGWAPVKTMGRVLKFTREVAQARKPIKILQNTGNVGKAAQLINRALADTAEKVKKITGMSKAEVAHSANPVNMQQVVPEQITGVAAEAQKQLEDEILARVGKVDQAYIKTTDPSVTPQRYYYDEAAKAARQRQVLGDEQDGVQVATIVDQTETGFTMQVERGFNPQSFYDRQTREAALAIAEKNLKDAEDQLVVLSQVKPSKVAGKPTLTLDEPTKALIEKANMYKEQAEMNKRILKDLDRPAQKRIEKINYTFDESGRQNAERLHGVSLPHVASPSQITDQLVVGASDEATLAEFTGTQILNNLNEAARDSIRGLTGKQVEDVDLLLQHGDEMGRVFNVQELIGSGVQTKWGLVKLDSTRSVAAYYAKRAAFDHLHRIENYLKRRGLENAGYKELHSGLAMRDGTKFKMYAKVEQGSIPEGVRRIYDHRMGGIVDVADLENLEGRLAGEWRVVRFRSGVRSGDEIINYGLIRDNDLRPIGGQVLNYRPGYVPKVRRGVFYVVSRNVKRMVDGVPADAKETVRFFRNRPEADRWKLQQADPENFEVVPDKAYTSPTHRTFDEEFDDLNFGGLYFGERTERDILMGLDGTEANRVSAYKALSLNMSHIANRYPMNELRMGLIGRFQNTYGQYLQNPTNWEGPLTREARNNSQLAQSIEAQRRYIKDLMRTPTMFEDWWSNKMRQIAESITSRPPIAKKNLNAKAGDFFMNLAAKDPISVIRGATFHLYLGAFNPAQVLVQGMGAATAMAAYPGKALKLLPQNVALMAAWAGRKNERAVKLMAGFAGAEESELHKIVKEIERVGLFDSLKSSADYQAGLEGFSASADAMRRIKDAGLVFMRSGEQWSRGYGYLLARDLFLSNKRAGYKLTDRDIDRIAADSWRFTLNLNRSNRAWWQKGVLSIPTQFYQVITKFLENMVGGSLGYGVRKWTPAEKTKIMTGYLAMFGAAGIPFMDSVVSDALNARKQATDDPEMMSVDKINPFNNLPPELRVSDEAFARFVRGGLTQVMASWTGADPELSTRFSIPAGIEETFDMYKNGNRGTLELIGGAAAPGMMRWFDAARGLYDIFGPGRTLDIGDDEMRQAVMEVANIFSSTRNAVSKAAWYDHIGKITNTKGERLFGEMENDQFSATLVWQALGFQPANVGWMYDLQGSVKELEGRVQTALDGTQQLMSKYAPTEDYITSQHQRDNLNFRINLLIADLTPAEQDKFYEGLKTISEKIYGDKNKMTEIITKAIEASATAGGLTTAGSAANPLLIPTGTE